MQRKSPEPDPSGDATSERFQARNEAPASYDSTQTDLVSTGPIGLDTLNQPWPISQRPQPSLLSLAEPYMDATGALLCEFCLARGIQHQEFLNAEYKNTTVHVYVYEGNAPIHLRGKFNDRCKEFGPVGHDLARMLDTQLRQIRIDSDRRGLSLTFRHIGAVDRLLGRMGSRIVTVRAYRLQFSAPWCSDWRGIDGRSWLPGTDYKIDGFSLYKQDKDPEQPKRAPAFVGE